MKNYTEHLQKLPILFQTKKKKRKMRSMQNKKEKEKDEMHATTDADK